MSVPKNILNFPNIVLTPNYTIGRANATVQARYNYKGIVKLGFESSVVYNSNKDGEVTNTIASQRLGVNDIVILQSGDVRVPVDGFVFLDLNIPFVINAIFQFNSVQQGNDNTIITTATQSNLSVAIYE
jgi:hypothetical protein